MTERIDHAKRALEAIAYIEAEAGWMEYAPHATAVATAHATLALVEQQRIANLIALSQKQQMADGSEIWVSSFLPDGKLRSEIREALGID